MHVSEKMQFQVLSVQDTSCSNFVNSIRGRDLKISTKRPVMQRDQEKQKHLNVSPVTTLVLGCKVEGA